MKQIVSISPNLFDYRLAVRLHTGHLTPQLRLWPGCKHNWASSRAPKMPPEQRTRSFLGIQKTNPAVDGQKHHTLKIPTLWLIMNDAPPQISMSDITGYNCFGWTVQGLIFCQPDPTMQPKHNVEIWGRGKKPHASMQWGGAAALPHFWVENKCVHTYHVHPDGAKIEPQFKGEKNGFCAGAAMQNDIKRFFRNPLIFDGVFSEAVFFPRFHVSSFVLFYVVIFCRVFYPNASAYTIYRPKFQCWTRSSTIVSVEGLILVCSGPNHAAKAQHWNLGGGGRQKLACYGKSSRANISLDIAGRHDINKYSHQNGFKLYWNQTISLPNRRLPVIIGNLGQGVSEQHPLLWELDRKSTLHTVKVNPYSQHLVWIPRVWTIP